MTTSEQETVTGQAASDASVPVEGPENISQIREILFGRHMEEYERRFSRLEERITSAANAIQDEFGARLTELEASIERELKALAKDLRSEQDKKVDGVEHDLDAARSDLQAGVAGLREELASHVKSLGDDLQREQHASDLIGREAAALREQKVDRTALAALLKEVVERLEPVSEPNGASGKR